MSRTLIIVNFIVFVNKFVNVLQLISPARFYSMADPNNGDSLFDWFPLQGVCKVPPSLGNSGFAAKWKVKPHLLALIVFYHTQKVLIE